MPYFRDTQFGLSQSTCEAMFKTENPQTSYAQPFDPAQHGFTIYFEAPKPDYDPITQSVREVTPVLTGKGHYEQAWEVSDLSPEQIAANQEAAKKAKNDSLLAQILVLQNKCLRCLVEDAPDTTWLDKYKAQIADLRSQLQ